MGGNGIRYAFLSDRPLPPWEPQDFIIYCKTTPHNQTIALFNPHDSDSRTKPKLEKQPHENRRIALYLPLPLPIISLYLIMESTLWSFSCCLNLLMKSSAFASTSWSPPVALAFPLSLTVAGRRTSTISSSSSSAKCPNGDFKLADFLILAGSLGGTWPDAGSVSDLVLLKWPPVNWL